MRQWIKPGTNFDFVGKQRTFVGVSVAAVAISLLSLAVFGLNLGIDFRGGTKLILAFTADADVDREKIREAIFGYVSKATGNSDAQVEVQDFDVGSDATGVRRFVSYTEAVTLLNDQKREEITASLKKTFGESTSVEAVSEGEDKFYLNFPDKKGVVERAEAIRMAFSSLGFANLSVQSEAERVYDMEYYKTLNLAEMEKGDGAGPSPFEKSLEEFRAEKTEKLKAMEDTAFTVRIEELSREIGNSLMTAFGADFMQVESATSVSPSVGEDMLNDGLIALFYSLIGILLYVALRFDFTYAPGGVIALAHDAIITLGVFSILGQLIGLKFSQPIIAAILTIIGFSINDTIVVYDRIREWVPKMPGKTLGEVINRSINDTLSRTILTTFTVLLAAMSLFFFGGGMIRDFAFALLIGLIVGTYSSIFIAAPIVMVLDRYFKNREEIQKRLVAVAGTASIQS